MTPFEAAIVTAIGVFVVGGITIGSFVVYAILSGRTHEAERESDGPDGWGL